MKHRAKRNYEGKNYSLTLLRNGKRISQFDWLLTDGD